MKSWAALAGDSQAADQWATTTGGGYYAVGVGGALMDARAVAAGDFDTIARAAERLVANVRAAREPVS